MDTQALFDGGQISEIPALQLVAGNPYQGIGFSRIAADFGKPVFDPEAIAVVLIPQHDEQGIGGLPTPELSR